MAAELAVGGSQVGEQVLGYFWELAALEEDKRIAAAEAISAQLEREQADATLAGASLSKQASPGGAIPVCAPSVDYAVKRLLRGLESHRQAARQGFALALTAVLEHVPSLPTTQLLDALEASLEAPKNLKGSDAKNLLLGRIFGYAAFARAGRLTRSGDITRCTSALVEILHRKAYLREAAASVLIIMLEGLSTEKFEKVLGACQGMQDLLRKPADESSAETLWLCLHLWPIIPASVLAGTPILPQGSPAPPQGYLTSDKPAQNTLQAAAAFLSHPHLQSVLPLLLSTSLTFPKLHSLWPSLMQLLRPAYDSQTSSSVHAGAGQLEALWSVVVEAQMFTSSLDRKALGLQLFSLLLPHLRPEHVPVVFSPQFLRCLTSNSAQQDSQLRPLAKKCVKGLVEYLDNTPHTAMRVAVVVALQRQNGIAFDKLTNTHLSARLMQGLDAEGITLYLQQLPSGFAVPPLPSSDAAQSEGEDEDGISAAEKSSNAARTWVIEQMTAAARSPKCPQADIAAAAQFLAVQAFCTASGKASKGEVEAVQIAAKCQPPVSEATRQLSAARLLTLTGAMAKPHIRKRKAAAAAAAAYESPDDNGDDEDTGQATGKKRRKDETGASEAVPAQANGIAQLAFEGDVVLDAVVKLLRRAEGGTDKILSLHKAIPAEVKAAVVSLLTSSALASDCADHSSATAPRPAHARPLSRLCDTLHLFFLADPENADTDLATDLHSIVADALAPSSAAEEVGEGSAPWVDRLMDVLLSLLAKGAKENLPFAPLREAVEAVFKTSCPRLTPTGMQDMLRVIAQPLDPKQQGQDDDEEEQDEGIMEPDAQTNGSSSDAEADEAESDDAEVESSDQEGEEEEEDDEEEASDRAGSSGDEEEGSSSNEDADMTDAQMFRMNAALSAALKSATQGKSQASKKAIQEALIDFKMRVLSLLEIFVKRMPGSPLVATAVPLLLTSYNGLVGPRGNPQLASRLGGLLESKIGRGKLDRTGEGAPEVEDLKQLLASVRGLVGRERHPRVAACTHSAFLYLLRLAVAAGEASAEHQQAAVQAWGDAMEDVLAAKSSHWPLSVLIEAARRFPSAALPHWEALNHHCNAAQNEFLKQQALELVTVLVKLPQKQLKPHLALLSSPALTKAISGAIHGSFIKPARQIGGIKVAIGCVRAVQALPDADTLLDTDKLIKAVDVAFNSSPTDKVGKQLQRMLQALDPSTTGVPHPQLSISRAQKKHAKHMARERLKKEKEKLKAVAKPKKKATKSADFQEANTEGEAMRQGKSGKKAKRPKPFASKQTRGSKQAKAARSIGGMKTKIKKAAYKRVRKGEAARQAAMNANVRAS